MREKRKRIKSLLVWVLIFGMVSLNLNSVALAQKFAGDEQPAEEHRLTYTAENCFSIDRETGYITGFTDDSEEAATTVVIPQYVDETLVKGIGEAVFKDQTAIQKIILPATVGVFGAEAFAGCSSLSQISVYDTGIVLDENGEIVESGAEPEKLVYDANKNYLVDGEEYYEIVEKSGCVTLSASLQTVGVGAFNGCAFSSFDVMEGNPSFTDSRETDNNEVNAPNLPSGVGACLLSADGKKLIRLAPRYKIDNSAYAVPSGVERIASYAFHKISQTRLVLPSSVTVIEDYGFYESGLSDQAIEYEEPAALTTVGAWAFANNPNLNIVLPATVTTIGVYCFANVTNRTPDISQTQITVIPQYAFSGCENLHQITMPATLRVIEDYAFAGNSNLNEVIFLGTTLESIGTGAFQDCANMHSIDIPEGVTVIEADTFAGCDNLNTVGLPDTLTTIGDAAFAGCQNIHSMVIPESVTYIADDSFMGANTSQIDTSKNEYAKTVVSGETTQTAAPTTAPVTQTVAATPTPTPAATPTPTPAVPKKGTKKTIGSLVYKVTKSSAKKGTVSVVKPKTKKIKTAGIPATVKINGYTFQVTEISKKAFYQNKKLTSVTIGKNVKKIGKQAFAKCKKLKKVTIKTTKLTNKNVGSGAFTGASKKITAKVPKIKKKAYKKWMPKKGIKKNKIR